MNRPDLGIHVSRELLNEAGTGIGAGGTLIKDFDRDHFESRLGSLKGRGHWRAGYE